MKKMVNIATLMTLALLVSCNAEKISKVKFVHALEGESLSGEMKINGQELNLSGSAEESFEVKPMYPRKLKLKLDYNHGPELNKLSATEINMEFEVRNYDSEEGSVDLRKAGSVKLQGDKLKLTNCTNTVDFKVDGSELIVDMSKFKSLASCKVVGKYKNYNRIGEEGRLHNGFGRNFFKFATDSQFGKEAAYEIVNNFSRYIYQDGEMAEYLKTMITKIAKASDMPEVEPKVFFINAPIENAFALPGGYVFVFRGLVDSLETEAELAGVLGHEWAHVTERHGTESVTRNLKSIATKFVGAGFVWANFGILGGAATYYVYDKLEDIPLMGFSRIQELEADKLGVQYAYKAGYSPYGLGKYFSSVPDYDETFFQAITSSHPKSSTRVEKIEELIFNYIPYDSSLVVTSTEYEKAKESIDELQAMPPYVVRQLMVSMGALVESSIKKSVRKKLKLDHKLEER
ncbi:M48 family metallopeptidase [Halobacteriovorax sp. CON-3]|uniref:M48 family metallopeptidase n=1 Tax=Halobacteriovorax sp. CON-3 TaxID=3157710 RepID=UPI0037235078